MLNISSEVMGADGLAQACYNTHNKIRADGDWRQGSISAHVRGVCKTMMDEMVRFELPPAT